MREKRDILSMTYSALEEEILALGEPRYRAEQIFSWLHKKRTADFGEITCVSRQFRQTLRQKFCINRLNIVKKLASKRDNTVKYLYELPDGNFVETVLMDYHHGKSLCISTQVGCRMGCTFCASTKAGFVRNLAPSEMLLQIYETERDTGAQIDSLVLMGIGEPLDNFENVLQFFEVLSDRRGSGMSLRRVALSTCGLAPEIRALAQRRLGLTLSLSLHSPSNQKRSAMMPINRRYPIEEVLCACRYYYEKTSRRVTIEYAVIDGVNCSGEDAEALARRLRGLHCHINLIPINPITEQRFSASAGHVAAFQKALSRYGLEATVRRTLGSDIQAACGQLRRDALFRSPPGGDEN